MIHDHYNIPVSTYEDLLKSGVEPVHFIRYLNLFDPNETKVPLSKINLLYYIDNKGSFDEPPLVPHKRIAKAIFNNLQTDEQIEVMQYSIYIEDLN